LWKDNWEDVQVRTTMNSPFAATTLGDCWFLTGPTASGKTFIGIELAGLINAEIISLDSMAVYRQLDISTAKPTKEQRAQVPHHLLDIVEPNQEYSLANYVAAAEECVRDLRARGKEALFVGGTPLYLKALLRGIFSGPPADWEFRREVTAEVQRVGAEALHARLAQVDPLSAHKLHPHNVRRIIRALEVYKITGQPISHLQMQFEEGCAAADCRVFVLQWPRPQLHLRIDQRVDRMFAEGLVDEIRFVRDKYVDVSRTAAQAVGFREVVSLLQHECDEAETIRRVKVRTRRFARRQETWFRSLSECRFVSRTDDTSSRQIAEQIAAT
jgi:tRNA dimethylallyltransferase